MNQVLIIIVTYNGSKYLERLFSSLESFGNNSDVLVIDNHSTDDSCEIIERFNNLKLMKLTKNVGFGGANNLGLNYACTNHYQFVFLLNQDTFLTKPIFDDLIKISKLNGNHCLLSPLQKNGSNNRLEPLFEKFLYESGFISKILLEPNENDFMQIYKMDFIQAASWFLPIEVIKIIGGFDPIFFHYGEDNNYCQRLQFFDIPIYVVPSTSICHDSNPFNENYPRNYDKYHLNRLKCSYLIKYTNINKIVDFKPFNRILFEFLTKSLKFLIKLQFKRLFGLFKYSIFQIQSRDSISKSIQKNRVNGMHYIS